MYYTDVFVGTDNIDKLKNALKAELKGSVKTDDLKELEPLADGLESFIGYDKGGLNGSGIGKSGYESSYKDASWPECGSSSKCSGCRASSSSCSHSGPSTSCHGSCCKNCDVRKAAKIFLGMLPCLYYALKYLYKQCEGDWKTFNISEDKPLRRFFAGMGYEIEKLDGEKNGQNISGLLETLFTGSNPLQSLYEKSKEYFTSLSSRSLPSGSPPTTVREILLWLSGLPFTSGFEALLKHCERLCDSIKDSKNSVQFNDFDNFETSLFDSCFLSPFVLGAIEVSKSDEEALKGFPLYKSEISKFSYPEDPSDLLEKLCENVRKIFVPLKFLCMQCERDNNDAGWKDCTFGQKCADALKSSSTSGFTSSSGSGSGCTSCDGHETYLCTWSSSNKDVHDGHCLNGKCLGSNSGSCSGSGHTSGKCKFPCSHPLMRFLLDGSSDPQPSVSKSLFQPPKDFPSMGFKTEQLPSPGRSGESLFFILDVFVGKASSDEAHPVLRDLLRFLLCLTRTPPETLGELFVFFQKFKDSSVFTKKLVPWIEDEPGRPDGQKFTNALKKALEALKGSSHSSSHSNDLKSLYDCDGGSTCGPYLYPLIQDASDIFGDDFTKELCSMYLSWICYLPKDFKTLLEKFQGEFSSPSCCSSGSSSCTKIVECPCILPKFYKYGFTFMKASTLNNKKCSDFIAQLGNFLGTDSTLLSLIAEIEAFLWSIREPFFFFVLAFWAFVISYFLYVQLYKLDILELNSHDHPAWSFKIPPSILFSDTSSRLKDLSYFSL
ncbi:variant erythrocyte surface antigen-1 family protein [Babesia divergens]|uniref:Variant erythrocyte surface antigen-1 family protein n=1 Tax=Babesia divergens TaxID=32595 RepID=A0AAD9LJK9_BABDI|nr:variant erythrocyte surface antigen-1 family protein [Babesia divergens]